MPTGPSGLKDRHGRCVGILERPKFGNGSEGRNAAESAHSQPKPIWATWLSPTRENGLHTMGYLRLPQLIWLSIYSMQSGRGLFLDAKAWSQRITPWRSLEAWGSCQGSSQGEGTGLELQFSFSEPATWICLGVLTTAHCSPPLMWR